MRLMIGLSIVLWLGSPLAAGEPSALKDAPANTWVKLTESKTGGRAQPLFLYASGIKRFVLAGGTQGRGYGTIARHYDTEEFDLAAGRWLNAYPAGLEKDRPESGPLGEQYAKDRERHGNGLGGGPFYKDGEQLRLVAGGQWAPVVTNSYAWCYVPDDGRVYLSPGKEMFIYDTAKRTWGELKVKPRDTNLVWGSMCHDPVNKEILHTGGGGGSADVSTWAYSIAKNEWRKLEFGSAKLKELFAKSKNLRWEAKTLLGRCASRHAVAETAGEAKVDLVAEATRLAATAEKFAGEMAAAGLAGAEKAAGEMAAKRLNAAAAAVKAAGPTLSGAITPEKIAAVRAARAIFEQAVDALSPEPPGRARSQTVFDPVRKKIVLFGGDGLDRTLSDTWLYDSATRSWEQKFPEKCPAPRAGHILGWLPRAGKVVLAGGYSRGQLAQEIWTYDAAANAWQLLSHTPLAGGAGSSCPAADPRGVQTGAVNEDDVLVCVTTSGHDQLVTWACRIDASKADAAGTAARGAASGTYDFNRIDPADWEKLAQPDPAKARKILEDLPVNQWTALQFPKYAPGATNRWGTSAYDTDRHQFLLWGGGHATSHENDVAHFSLLGGFWTIGYHPDDPIENVYASQPVPLSFNDRAHVPMHAYKGYTYDPTAGKMFYFERVYNPLVREWEPLPMPGLEHRGVMHSHIKATPAGAVTWSDKGLFRFDAKAGAWQRLPWNGPKPKGDIGWCDGPCVIHDSKRNCLWMTYAEEIFRYDLAKGTSEKVAFSRPKALDQWIFRGGEAVHLPDADLVLGMCPLKRPDGKVRSYAWDPSDGKFYWLDLKWVEGGKSVEFNDKPFSYSDALAYDPELKLVLLNNSSARKVWTLRFDRKTAGLEEMKDGQ